jgi:hypothetical protein
MEPHPRKAPAMKRFLTFLFNGPWPLTFLLMGLFAWGLGVTSANLFQMLNANIRFLTAYGTMALEHGGARQLIELIGMGYLSLGFYVLFKGCLQGLLGRFGKH